MDSRAPWKAKDIVVIGVMTAVVEAAKTALAFLPNIELVTFLFVIFTIVFGRKTLPAVFAFVGLECFVWGLNIWVINYLYVWPLLVVITLLIRRTGSRSAFVYAILCGAFGLGFGALCAIPYLFIGGPVMMASWWVAGIPFDLIHGVSNFILCLVLFHPILLIVEKCRRFM